MENQVYGSQERRGKNLLIENYTYYEYVTKALKTKRSARSNKLNCKASDTGSQKFCGQTKNLKEAVNIAYNGWDSGIAQLKLSEGVLSGSGIEFEPSVQGALVNMSAYLQNQPDSMFNLSERREYNLEELVIYVNLTYYAQVKIDKAMNFCSEIIELINKYQSKHNIKLVGIFDNNGMTNGLKRNIHNVIIKDFNERFVLNKIAFAFHPSFFRRIAFKHWEIGDYCAQYGYGTVSSYENYFKYVKELVDVNNVKSIITPRLDSNEFDINNCEFLNF